MKSFAVSCFFTESIKIHVEQAGLLTYPLRNAFPTAFWPASGIVLQSSGGITAAGTVQEFPDLIGSPASLLNPKIGTYSAAKVYKRSKKYLFLQHIKAASVYV